MFKIFENHLIILQPTQDEIIDFVTNQWLLQDLREINNENGSLPKNLGKQKCTTLPGKYILQVFFSRLVNLLTIYMSISNNIQIQLYLLDGENI
jgi:hypothetical protein